MATTYELPEKPASPFRMSGVFALLIAFFWGLHGFCQAASDTDVKSLKASSVSIGDDKITIVAQAVVSMRVIVPDDRDVEGASPFYGRNAVWVTLAADKATFTIHKPKVGKDEWWQMTVNEARALALGKPVGRIGFYRPHVELRSNAIHSITGPGYLYPKRAD